MHRGSATGDRPRSDGNLLGIAPAPIARSGRSGRPSLRPGLRAFGSEQIYPRDGAAGAQSDRGYLGVDPHFRLRVSPRLRAGFSNGDQFYARAGQVIELPGRRAGGRPGSSWNGTSMRSSKPDEDRSQWRGTESRYVRMFRGQTKLHQPPLRQRVPR